MKGLCALAKFTGVYNEFKGLVSNYGLKWVDKSVDDMVIERLTKVADPDELFDWIRTVKQAVSGYSGFMDLMAATGLRFEEAVNAWNLVIDLSEKRRLGDYYKDSEQALEHFRFRQTFIRRTKKAFISFVSRDLVKQIQGADHLTTNAILKRLGRRHLKRRFGDIRELHGSLLTRSHSECEINFLHGRVSSGVFMANYFNPAWISDLRARTLTAANEILAKIS